MPFSRSSFVIGREGKEGDIQDVTISNTPEGLNLIQIARDARDVSPRAYVVDRKLLPDGNIQRLLEVDSFSDVLPERLSEVRVESKFESFPNIWGIIPEKTYGLPEGMESPWSKPIEMVSNELLVGIETSFVGGFAPVNTYKENSYKNGKYYSNILNDRIEISTNSGEFLGSINTNTSLTIWQEGIAGAASFRGGSLFIEPAKPPIFQGSFYLDQDPILIQPGLYQYGDNYLVSSTEIINKKGVGSIAFVKDPYPERWINRLMGRAYINLVSPAYIPPLVEEEPNRISITPFYLKTDFDDIKPKIVTPYANETGVFNSWDVEENPVLYHPSDRPYDVFIPFEKRLEDWGGFSVWSAVDFYPALDWKENPSASYPNEMPYEMPEIPEMRGGTLAFRWKDSNEFYVIKNNWLDVSFKGGYFYFENKVSPDSSGICKAITASNWNTAKIEWSADSLYVNDVPALIVEKEWEEVLGNNLRWGQAGHYSVDLWTPTYNNFPLDIEIADERSVTWQTGKEEYVQYELKNYANLPSTWGRILYESSQNNYLPVINYSSDLISDYLNRKIIDYIFASPNPI